MRKKTLQWANMSSTMAAVSASPCHPLVDDVPGKSICLSHAVVVVLLEFAKCPQKPGQSKVTFVVAASPLKVEEYEIIQSRLKN
jgi:hypothetical protein